MLTARGRTAGRVRPFSPEFLCSIQPFCLSLSAIATQRTAPASTASIPSLARQPLNQAPAGDDRGSLLGVAAALIVVSLAAVSSVIVVPFSTPITQFCAQTLQWSWQRRSCAPQRAGLSLLRPPLSPPRRALRQPWSSMATRQRTTWSLCCCRTSSAACTGRGGPRTLWTGTSSSTRFLRGAARCNSREIKHPQLLIALAHFTAAWTTWSHG